MVRTLYFLCGYLVGELRHHKLHGVARKLKKRYLKYIMCLTKFLAQSEHSVKGNFLINFINAIFVSFSLHRCPAILL